MRIGGVNLERGKIVNLVIDSVPSVPTFVPTDAGRFIFSLSDKVLRFNDGEKLVPLNTTISEDPNLKSSLGSNWLNADLSFNPVPFNDLPGIGGLNSNDSLFDVIDQIATNIENLSTIGLEDIEIDTVYPDMTVVAHLAGDLVVVSIEQVLEGSTISLNFDNLSGFDINDTTQGNMVIFNDENNLVSQKLQYKYVNYGISNSHLITHNLGQRHCSVFCINPATHKMLTPSEITFTSENQLTATFDEVGGVPLVAFVTNLQFNES